MRSFWIIDGAHNPKSSLHELKPIKVSFFCKKATWVMIKLMNR
jgi:folylpolyglutamate synthase/dihydropteroate synthase